MDYNPKQFKLEISYDRKADRFVAKCASLPGVQAEATTRAAAVLLAEDLLAEYMAGVVADARPTRSL